METKMKILVAYDGVHSIQNLIYDLKRAGLPKNSDVLVMTVVDALMPPSENYSDMSLPVEPAAPYIETIRKKAELSIKKELVQAGKAADKAAKTLRASFRGWKVNSDACVDSPAWAIVKKEDEWKPDLIVAESHSASVVARFFLGSVSRRVLIHSNGSVRIVRKHRKTKKPVRILIGMDGSLDSQMAVRVVSERSWPKGTSVRLVTGFDQNMIYAIAFNHLPISEKPLNFKDVDEEAWVRQMTVPFAKMLKNAGLKVTDVIKAGKPWKVLVEEAKNWKADCIFVGARGLGMVQRILLGSVSNAVASRAHCSVEVVRIKRR
jgi:nucleotide-binding universal stress UspA family protein